MDGDLVISDGVVIPGRELVERFSRSSGPGGQNVNKVATRVELIFDPGRSQAFDEPQRARLVEGLSGRLTGAGELVVASDEERSQGANRRRCRQKLAALLAEALRRRKRRIKTRPSRASVHRRLEQKRVRKERKKGRGRFGDE